MANTNCLEGMACPECGNLEPFHIWGTAVFLAHDDGTESYSDVAWEPDDQCACPSCGYVGTVGDFSAET